MTPNITTVEDLIAGRDGIARVAKVSARKTTSERAIQTLYPLELTNDRVTKESSANLRIEDINSKTD